MNIGIGHNNGPTMESGATWRRVSWGKARKALLPTLPIEVLRRRVNRAKELGLPYKTYASVRASTGRDVIGFLFSSNALRVMRAGQDLPDDRVMQLASLRDADRVGVMSGGLAGHPLDGLDAQFAAPHPLASWSDARVAMRDILGARNLPADAVLIVGETWDERQWVTAGKMAGFLSGDRYFAA